MLHVKKKNLFCIGLNMTFTFLNSFIKCVPEPSGDYTCFTYSTSSIVVKYPYRPCIPKWCDLIETYYCFSQPYCLLALCFKQNPMQLVLPFSYYVWVCELPYANGAIGSCDVTFMCKTNNMFWLSTLDHEKIYLLNKRNYIKFLIEILLLLIFCLSFLQPWYEVVQNYMHSKHHCFVFFIWNRFNILFTDILTHIHKIYILYILHCTSITHAAVCFPYWLVYL